MAEPFDGKTVLIVDDDADMVTAVAAMFEDTGVVIKKAGDGNTALQIAQNDNPDLIILDLMLPKRSGLLVLEKLKAKKPRGTKPYVIMITGNPGTRHKQFAESLGVDGYLHKPFRMEKLVDLARELLAR